MRNNREKGSKSKGNGKKKQGMRIAYSMMQSKRKKGQEGFLNRSIEIIIIYFLIFKIREKKAEEENGNLCIDTFLLILFM